MSGAFFLRRLLLAVPTLFGVAVIVFVLLRVVPGDPIAMLIGPGAGEASNATSVVSMMWRAMTGDPATVASQVEKLRGRFGLGRVVLVGDRGMITSARIQEDLKPQPGLGWITSLRSPAIRKLVEGASCRCRCLTRGIWRRSPRRISWANV